MKTHPVNNLDNFIGGWFIDDLSLCDDLIQYHKSNPNKFDGLSGKGVSDKQYKDSVDAVIDDEGLRTRYLNSMFSVCKQYIEKYSFCNYYSEFGVNKTPTIQYYKPTAGFHAWHCEKSRAEPIIAARHLVYMTYLNDVDDGGETEFYYQKIKIKPRKGLTLIWPTEWTFTHRGIPSPSEEKYIVTGWFNFVADHEHRIVKNV